MPNDPTKRHDDVKPNKPLDAFGTNQALKMANRAAQKISEMQRDSFRAREARMIAEMERSNRPIRFADELAESYHAVNNVNVRNRERRMAIDAQEETLLRNQAKMIQRAQQFSSARRDNTDVR